MNKKALHIVRSAVISFLMAGFLAHLIVPFSSHAQKTAFTRWLDHNVVESGNANEVKLRNTIRELPDQAGDFWLLIQQASELVANHQDHFRILVSNSGQNDNQHIPSWLIEQWNIFQDQKTGFNSVLTNSIKIFSNWDPQNPGFLFSFPNQNQYQRIPLNEPSYSFIFTAQGFIAPLISGISINAP